MTELEKRERKAHLLDELTALTERNEVHVKLASEDSMFNPYDPTIPESRDIAPEVESYLLEQLEKLPRKTRIKVDIALPSTEKYGEEKLTEAFRNHFSRRAEEQLLVNNRKFRKWLFNLMYGLMFLAACLVMAHVFNMNSSDHPFFSVLGESLSIIGWVAIWEPATYFLYGIREDMGRLGSFMRLHRADIALVKTAQDYA